MAPALAGERQRTMTDEQRQELEVLARLVRERKIDRRRLIQATAAIGLTSTAAGAAMTRVSSAAAQQSDKLLATVSTSSNQPGSATSTRSSTRTPRAGRPSPASTSRWPSQPDDRRARALAGHRMGVQRGQHELTFTLREGVKWSDGEAFTAKDVEFTFDYLAKTKRSPAPRACAASSAFLDEIEAPDDKTSSFNFTRSSPPVSTTSPADDRARAHLEGRRRSGHVHQREPGRHRPIHRDRPASKISTTKC